MIDKWLSCIYLCKLIAIKYAQSTHCFCGFRSHPAQELQVDPEYLRKTFGLTPAEIRIAVALCENGTIEEAAAKAGVAVSTVKSQLKQVYQKTGVDNRTRLTKLIVSLSAVL